MDAREQQEYLRTILDLKNQHYIGTATAKVYLDIQRSAYERPKSLAAAVNNALANAETNTITNTQPYAATPARVYAALLSTSQALRDIDQEGNRDALFKEELHDAQTRAFIAAIRFTPLDILNEILFTDYEDIGVASRVTPEYAANLSRREHRFEEGIINYLQKVFAYANATGDSAFIAGAKTAFELARRFDNQYNNGRWALQFGEDALRLHEEDMSEAASELTIDDDWISLTEHHSMDDDYFAEALRTAREEFLGYHNPINAETMIRSLIQDGVENEQNYARSVLATAASNCGASTVDELERNIKMTVAEHERVIRDYATAPNMIAAINNAKRSVQDAQRLFHLCRRERKFLERLLRH